MLKQFVAVLCCLGAVSLVNTSALGQTAEDLDNGGSRLEYPSHGARVSPLACPQGSYIPYTYPAFESCPCGADGCYHPAPYYGGSQCYRRSWFHKWLRAHLGLGSMLEDYPCPCVLPTGAGVVPAAVETE